MSLTAQDVQGFIEKNPYNSFAVICNNNDVVNYVTPEDVASYNKKRIQFFRLKGATAIAGGVLFGLGSARLLRPIGIVKGLAVGYLTFVGLFVGQQAGEIVTSGNLRAQENIIRRYPDFKSNPKVISFLQRNSFKTSSDLE